MEQTDNYIVKYTFSEQVMAYSYSVTSKSAIPMDFIIDCSKSSSMLFSTQEPIVTKKILPGQTEFLLHTRADCNKD